MRRHTAALALAALTAMAVPASIDAQTPRQGERGEHAGRMGAGQPAERILELRQELGLTEEQVADITRIQAELRSRNEPLHQQIAQARQEMQTRREQMTPEQREQMQARREAMRDSMQARREQMTPEQREQMREQMRAEMKQRRDGAARPRAGQAAGMRMTMPEELQPVMEQMRTNTETAMQQIRATLTAEQLEKLRELHADRRPAGRGGRGAR